jgi:hypothetical protein
MAKNGVRCRTSSAPFMLVGQATCVDLVSQIEHDTFGVHAEGGGDEFGVHGVDQVDQAGERSMRGEMPQESRTWLT